MHIVGFYVLSCLSLREQMYGLCCRLVLHFLSVYAEQPSEGFWALNEPMVRTKIPADKSLLPATVHLIHCNLLLWHMPAAR